MPLGLTQHIRMKSSSILLIGYNRPKNLNKRLIELREINRDKHDIFVVIDGPKDNQSPELHNQNIEILEKEKLQQEFNLVIRKKNLGLALNITSSITEILKNQKSILIFEDDIVISKAAISSMNQMLMELDVKKYATVGAFGIIPYTNFCSKINRINQFRSTPYFSAWGWGIRQEVWRDYKLDISKENRISKLEQSKNFMSLSEGKREIWLNRFERISTNVNWTWDYQMQYMSFITERNHVLPYFRLVDNCGFNDQNATNTIGKRPRWYLFPNSRIASSGEIHNFSVKKNKFLEICDSISISGDLKFKWRKVLRIFFNK